MLSAEASMESISSGPEVSVIIVGYRSKALIVDCLQSIYAHTSDLSVEVIVIDNSDDGTVEAVRERFPQVQVIDNRRNLGFGPGNNLAAAHAGGRYLLFLNPDTLLLDDAIGKLTVFAKAHPEAGVWGGVCVLPDGKVDPGSCQVVPTVGEMALALVGLSSLRRKPIRRDEGFAGQVPVVSGAFMMVDAVLWREMGGFDESFKLYSEEVDLCRRVREKGRRVLMTGAARVRHLVGHGSVYSPSRTMAKTRGCMHYIRKHRRWPGQVTAAAVLIWIHALSRYVAGVALFPVLGQQRANTLRAAFGPIVLRPCAWWSGWSGRDLHTPT